MIETSNARMGEEEETLQLLWLLLFLYFRLNEKLRAVSNFDFVNKYIIMVSTERKNNYPKP